MTLTKLYFCPTPIGNLSDISLRTLEVLEMVDIIACEDTRVSVKLLNHYNIKKKLFSYHEHNEHEASEKLLAFLKEGKSIALITDAGMPGISDPGEILARHAIEAGIEFTVLPGASAIFLALLQSGFSSRRFIFEGFLPRKGKERQTILNAWENEGRTIIFYEAPHRLEKTLEELKTLFPNRPLSVSRELTKKFEETIRGTCQSVYEHFFTHSIKGEFVLVLGKEEKESSEDSFSLALKKAQDLLLQGYKTKAACNQVAQDFNLPKRSLYQALINTQDTSEGEN